MLQVSNLSKFYPQAGGVVRALEDVSLHVAAEEFVVVRGPSGCGKSTLLLTAGGLLSPTTGQVTVDGQDPYQLGPERRAAFRASAVGFVFQQFHLVPYLNVTENVLTAALAAEIPDAAARAGELIDRFGLTDRADHRPSQLSTGERQRTALARAMLNRPKLILADEPTGNLDDENAQGVLTALAEYARDGGTVLLVTHDGKVDAFAHRTVRLRGGKIDA